jgi:signal peptidase complex subunit 2
LPACFAWLLTHQSPPDLKNTSDDALANYLNSLGFRQSHTMTDVRLGLGYTALVVAAACFAWDYQLGWDATKTYTAVAVAVYALLNGAFTLWVWLVEQGTVYQGLVPGKKGEDDKTQLFVATNFKKGEPVYQLKVAIVDGKTQERTTSDFSVPFSQFFDEAGYFVADAFQRILVKNISVVAKADPKRASAPAAKPVEEKASAAAEEGETQELDPELLDAVLQAEAKTTGTDKKKSGGKRRKA